MEKQLRFLKIYAAISSLVLVALVTSAFVDRSTQHFGTIDVQRINVLGANGKLRMYITGGELGMPAYYRGKELLRPDRNTAGLMFLNSEGTEEGGFTWGGATVDGVPSNYEHLSFDDYEQDQTFSLDEMQQGENKRTGFVIVDRPNWSWGPLLKLPQSQWAHWFASHRTMPHERAYFGSTATKTVALRLYDPQGRPRLVIKVGTDGKPVIQFLSAAGKVISQLPSADGK
jgi:hypothetical protein